MPEMDLGPRVIRGEFCTDGRTFVFNLKDTPLSGIGATPQEAFDDLLLVEAKAGTLPHRLAELAREQADAAQSASLVRIVVIGLVALTIVGGALGGAVALAPRVASDILATTLQKVDGWLAGLSPEARRSISSILHPPAEGQRPAEQGPPIKSP
jgi:hypothetical protein